MMKDLLYEAPAEKPTEYDVFILQKLEEFTSELLEDNTSYEVEALLRMCDDYINEKKNHTGDFCGSGFGIIMLWDMWINKSAVWPISRHNPEWDEWDKLKTKRIEEMPKSIFDNIRLEDVLSDDIL